MASLIIAAIVQNRKKSMVPFHQLLQTTPAVFAFSASAVKARVRLKRKSMRLRGVNIAAGK
jgi:hypothetical protein